VRPGARANLGRPKESPVTNKRSFMQHVQRGRSAL
jgi:hypothetical protein